MQHLPAALWDAELPGTPRRSVRMILGHVHNSRCSWVKVLGREHGITTPASVDRRSVARRELLSALKRSSKGIESLLELGLANGGHVPPSRGYVWRNLPLDVPHVLTYFVAHEGHHRGQIVMVARQLGHRLPHRHLRRALALHEADEGDMNGERLALNRGEMESCMRRSLRLALMVVARRAFRLRSARRPTRSGPNRR